MVKIFGHFLINQTVYDSAQEISNAVNIGDSVKQVQSAVPHEHIFPHKSTIHIVYQNQSFVKNGLCIGGLAFTSRSKN